LLNDVPLFSGILWAKQSAETTLLACLWNDSAFTVSIAVVMTAYTPQPLLLDCVVALSPNPTNLVLWP
jgi:hypothetical protein